MAPVAPDPYLLSRMPLESLSTQTCPITDPLSEAEGYPVTIPKVNTGGMHMYIHAYIFLQEFLCQICSQLLKLHLKKKKSKIERKEHVCLRECVLNAEGKKIIVLQLNGQSCKCNNGVK